MKWLNDPLTRMIVRPTVFIALIFFAIGIYEAVITANSIKNYTSAEGTIVDNEYILFPDSGGGYIPVVLFYNDNGEKVRFTDQSYASYPPDFEIGESVPVLYDLIEPHQARIATWERLWLGSLIWGLSGLFPIATGFLIAYFTFRSRVQWGQ